MSGVMGGPLPFRAGLRRHDLLTVAPDDWDACIDRIRGLEELPLEAVALLRGWAQRGWPAIVRRRCTAEPPGAVPIGVPLPLCFGKLRIASSLPAGVPVTPRAAVGLASALPHAPPAWRGVLAALLDLGTALKVEPRPFGGLLWQAETRLAYLHPGSDLDLIWPVAERAALLPLLAELRRLDREGPVRLDGEVMLPDGAGVNWRELDRALGEPRGEVLAKGMSDVALRRADALFP